MRPRFKLRGATLFDVLISSALLTLVLGALFAAFGALSRTVEMQSARSRFVQTVMGASDELINKALSARGRESILINNEMSSGLCQEVHGYYVQTTTENKGVSLESNRAEEDGRLIVLNQQRRDDSYEWIKYEYSREIIRNDAGEVYGSLVERTYRLNNPEIWPAVPNRCGLSSPWQTQPFGTRYLTSESLDVSAFSLRLVSFLPDKSNRQSVPQAPFLTLSVQIKDRAEGFVWSVQKTGVPRLREGVLDES